MNESDKGIADKLKKEMFFKRKIPAILSLSWALGPPYDYGS